MQSVSPFQVVTRGLTARWGLLFPEVGRAGGLTEVREGGETEWQL
jgi:hypothetical protein